MIRALTRSDAEAYRALRLEALREAPEAFASSFELESARPLDHFAERAAGTTDDRIFAVEGQEGLLGMAGFFRDTHTKMRHRGHVWGMYVQPAARGRGRGRALMEAVLEHARGLDGLLQVNLEVVTSNGPALRLYSSLGFERFGTERRALIVDGRALDEALLVLPLTPL